MEKIIREDEAIDDLQNGYKIIQKKDNFRFGVDAVLLSDFADIKTKDRILEIGTGTGIIPILINAKKKPNKIIAVEIQSHMVEMAKRSIELNKLENIIEIINIDMNDCVKAFEKASFDCVVTNPPYVKKNCGINNPLESKAISRFEIKCNLEQVVTTSKQMVKSGGKLFMVHRADRLVDIIYIMREQGIEPKRIRFVHPYAHKRPNLVLIEGARGGKPELKFMNPLYIYDSSGNYTEEINRIYGRIN